MANNAAQEITSRDVLSSQDAFTSRKRKKQSYITLCSTCRPFGHQTHWRYVVKASPGSELRWIIFPYFYAYTVGFPSTVIQQGKCDVLGKTLAQKHLRASLPGQTLEVQSRTEPEHLAAWPQQAAAPSTTPGTRTHLSLPRWDKGLHRDAGCSMVLWQGPLAQPVPWQETGIWNVPYFTLTPREQQNLKPYVHQASFFTCLD